MRGYSVFALVASFLMFSPARSGSAQTTEFDKVKVPVQSQRKGPSTGGQGCPANL